MIVACGQLNAGTLRLVAVFTLVLFTQTRKQIVYGVCNEYEMILKLDKLQPRKDKPAVLGSITLLDIVANGTAIRLFKETVVVFGETSRKRIVMNVRRHSGKGWVAKQVIWPASDLELALLEVNKVAQQEIQRATTLAIA